MVLDSKEGRSWFIPLITITTVAILRPSDIRLRIIATAHNQNDIADKISLAERENSNAARITAVARYNGCLEP